MDKHRAASAAFMVTAATAGAAVGARERAEETLAKYEKTGETQTCIPLRSIRDTHFLDDYTMMVEVAGGAMYLNELSGRCPGLYREQRYVHSTSTADMCRGDIIRVIDGFGTMTGGCGLGDFEKLEKLPEAAK